MYDVFGNLTIDFLMMKDDDRFGDKMISFVGVSMRILDEFGND